ncbi:uncharacterized protein UBRO2_01732 [Ustilago bromivora]|uniref:Uncharacterized protein n=1 Tax=Ustilago bromivora TaxID=307758 RepID=A0A8H8QJM3_9BASI|nr:uncharacterized protein UBRO2_01732 [Ustilago bromivora]
MKLTVPEISMRSRLKRHTLTDTPKTPKKPSRSKTDGGNGEADDAGEGSDEEFANEDENAIAALDANQEPINLDDPKFANIPNLGIKEKGPQTGDVLHISVGPPGQERPVQIPRGMSERLDRMGVVPDEGHIMNAGGHVYDLGWVPVPVHLNTGKEYFVVSAAGSKAPMTLVGQKQQRPAPASLQVWSVSPDLPAASDDYVIRAHRSAITDLTFILAPPISSSGHILHTCLPQTLFSIPIGNGNKGTILCDPVLSRRASPVQWFSPERYTDAPVTAEEIAHATKRKAKTHGRTS